MDGRVTISISDEPPTDVLMEVQIPVVSPKKCLSAYKDFKHLRIDDSVLCAGLDAGGKDACRVTRLTCTF